MKNPATPKPQPPPIFQQGYAVFVKLWDINANISADVACSIFNSLDKILLSLNGGKEEQWFPSPYGGAIVVSDIEGALGAARTVIQRTGNEGIVVSVGIAFGRFERVLNVTRWNTAALAMNMAARMASSPALKGRVIVQPKVRNDAVLAKMSFEAMFGPEQATQVKRTLFAYHLVDDPNYEQRVATAPQTRRTRTRAQSADIVLFDIEKYTEKSQEEQSQLVESLSKCVEVALSTEREPRHFGPAGDGAYLAFVANAGSGVHAAWSFAKNLKTQAERENIPIRIGIANGPILSSNKRAIVGGVVILADLVTSEAPSGEIAVTREFWETLASQLKSDWQVASESKSFLILKNAPPTPTNLDDRTRQATANQIPEASKFEIEMYWGYRPAAHEDLRQAILTCKSKLFIAGLGVTTIANVLNDPHVIKVLADHITRYPEFERTIVTLTRADDPRINEQGGKELEERIRIGRKALRRFYGALERRVPTHIVRPLIDFKSYEGTTIPRHFILQADQVIYAGSYLSHQQGAYSYLIKIRNLADGLYALFADEIAYIKQHTVPQYIEGDP